MDDSLAWPEASHVWKTKHTTLAQAKCAVKGTALQLVVKELRLHCSYKRRSANMQAQEKNHKQERWPLQKVS